MIGLDTRLDPATAVAARDQLLRLIAQEMEGPVAAVLLQIEDAMKTWWARASLSCRGASNGRGRWSSGSPFGPQRCPTHRGLTIACLDRPALRSTNS